MLEANGDSVDEGSASLVTLPPISTLPDVERARTLPHPSPPPSPGLATGKLNGDRSSPPYAHAYKQQHEETDCQEHVRIASSSDSSHSHSKSPRFMSPKTLSEDPMPGWSPIKRAKPLTPRRCVSGKIMQNVIMPDIRRVTHLIEDEISKAHMKKYGVSVNPSRDISVKSLTDELVAAGERKWRHVWGLQPATCAWLAEKIESARERARMKSSVSPAYSTISLRIAQTRNAVPDSSMYSTIVPELEPAVRKIEAELMTRGTTEETAQTSFIPPLVSCVATAAVSRQAVSSANAPPPRITHAAVAEALVENESRWFDEFKFSNDTVQWLRKRRKAGNREGGKVSYKTIGICVGQIRKGVPSSYYWSYKPKGKSEEPETTSINEDGKKESRPSSSIEVLAHVTSSSSEDELPSATRRKRSRTEGELRTDDRTKRIHTSNYDKNSTPVSSGSATALDLLAASALQEMEE